MDFDGFSNALELAKTERANENSENIEHETVIEENSPYSNRLKNEIQKNRLPPLPNTKIKNQTKNIKNKNNTDKLIKLISSHIILNDRLMIVSSGTKSKSIKFKSHMDFTKFKRFLEFKQTQEDRKQAIPANKLYIGNKHKELCFAIDTLKYSYDVKHRIISPLYGLMTPSQLITPYECTFLDKSYYIQVKMAIHLNTPFQLQQLILSSQTDVIILALSKSYQVILDLIPIQAIKHKTVYLLRYKNNEPHLVHIGI